MDNPDRRDIRKLSLTELEAFFSERGEKPFRARQVYDWLWQKGALSFEAMTNLSKATRQLLAEHFFVQQTRLGQVVTGADRTIKVTVQLGDGRFIESVLIPAGKRITACVSSQVGCPLGCKFCATGELGFVRNLSFDEIFDQVVIVDGLSREQFSLPVSHIVFMGMGEPLLNYDHVLTAIAKITAPGDLGLSPRRITVSTVGLADKIRRLGDDRVRFNLALSLHAADDQKRRKIMPVAKVNPLSDLLDAIAYFYRATGTRITIEYLLLKDVNDSLDDARDVACFCKNFPVKINILEYNPTKEPIFARADRRRLDAFVAYLQSKNLVVSVRKSKGQDIAAACGQLANRLSRDAESCCCYGVEKKRGK